MQDSTETTSKPVWSLYDDLTYSTYRDSIAEVDEVESEHGAASLRIAPVRSLTHEHLDEIERWIDEICTG